MNKLESMRKFIIVPLIVLLLAMILPILTRAMGTTTNVGLAAGGGFGIGIQIDGNLVAFVVSEFSQNNTDLNGDGDADDLVLHVFDISAITPADATQNLIDLINSISLPTNVENPLTAPLSQAVNLLNDDNPSNDTAVCEQLTALINQVDAKEQNGMLSAEQATQLKQDAEAIKTSLSCP